MKRSAAAAPLALDTLPGHYIRRLQQIAVAVFLQETDPQGITPVQIVSRVTGTNFAESCISPLFPATGRFLPRPWTADSH